MTVIAFRPRPSRGGVRTPDGDSTAITGTFRSPRGRPGCMTGHLRLRRLVIAPRGAFVTGVFTGELREPDGTLIGVDSRRATAPADLVRDDRGMRPVVRPLQLDLMGITIEVDPFAIEPSLAFPRGKAHPGRRTRRAFTGQDPRGTPVSALALVAPALVLGLLHVLAKLEVWTMEESAPRFLSQGRPRPSRGRVQRDRVEPDHQARCHPLPDQFLQHPYYVKGMSPAVLRHGEDRVMGELPSASTGEAVRVPVPRDPPPPPGYVDPLGGSGALDDLVPADLPDADQDDHPQTGTSKRRPPTT